MNWGRRLCSAKKWCTVVSGIDYYEWQCFVCSSTQSRFNALYSLAFEALHFLVVCCKTLILCLDAARGIRQKQRASGSHEWCHAATAVKDIKVMIIGNTSIFFDFSSVFIIFIILSFLCCDVDGWRSARCSSVADTVPTVPGQS